MGEERQNGLEVKIGYRKVMIDGNWYEWRNRRQTRTDEFSEGRGTRGRAFRIVSWNIIGLVY